MLSFGPLSLVAPWALLAAAILPLLWWLLRVTPPSPRVVRFPAIRLLFGLSSREQTPARTPLWLVLLRMLLALLVILAVAHPLINASRTKAAGGLLLIALDDGWAAARNWAARQTVLDALLDEAERAERPVAVLTTAAPVDGGPITPIGPLSARDARAAVQALAPKAWGTDRRAAAAALATLARRRRPAWCGSATAWTTRRRANSPPDCRPMAACASTPSRRAPCPACCSRRPPATVRWRPWCAGPAPRAQKHYG